MYDRIPQNVCEAFHGSPPRLLTRMLRGPDSWPAAWRESSRVPRKAILDTLATLGLTIVVKQRGQGDYIYHVGVFVPISA